MTNRTPHGSIIGLTLLLVLFGCTQSDPLPIREGIVVDSWDKSPIPGATVLLMETVAGGGWTGGGLIISDSIHADDRGIFDYPRYADYYQFGGRSSGYFELSDYMQTITSYSIDMELIEIPLRPLAWISITAEDQGLSETEITYIEVDCNLAYLGNDNLISTPVIGVPINSTDGTVKLTVRTSGGGIGNEYILNLDLIKQDTLDYVVAY
ncbi:MAG: hypothetical protein HKN32_03725 [Flavobacteriales bacterium]|nr:hypothetical protein [Flavobacteriales bacterium]